MTPSSIPASRNMSSGKATAKPPCASNAPLTVRTRLIWNPNTASKSPTKLPSKFSGVGIRGIEKVASPFVVTSNSIKADIPFMSMRKVGSRGPLSLSEATTSPDVQHLVQITVTPGGCRFFSPRMPTEFLTKKVTSQTRHAARAAFLIWLLTHQEELGLPMCCSNSKSLIPPRGGSHVGGG